MIELLDAHHRERSISERERNVIVDASAGTGKTRLVVERIVELVAPKADRQAIPIARIAVITFTRKAAGELRVRTRQWILHELSQVSAASPRGVALLAALGGIDTVHIGTIHGFADRLLRRFPAQARLDPLYALEDDEEALVDECFQALVQGAEAGTLGELLDGTPAAERAGEAMTTIGDMQRAGLRLRSLETEHWTYHGLQSLVSGLVLHRDADVPEPLAAEFDHATFNRFVEEYLRLVERVSPEPTGGRWMHAMALVLRRVAASGDPVEIFREVMEPMLRGPCGRASDQPTKKHHFGGDASSWDAWKAFRGDERKEPVRTSPLRDDMLEPLRRWMAARLVRLRPVVLRAYEVMKARRQVVDHVDLLLRLRDLLRDDLGVRVECQQLFDHIFVDEFQDTDPLQAEIVTFLSERGHPAVRWDDARIAPGVLTVVGDPKQSIYRFRRADIATYQRMIDIIGRSPHITISLTSSFRSAPGLVEWLNSRFTKILGVGANGERFHTASGDVYYQSLSIGRAADDVPTVHAVAMDLPDGGDAAAYRALEATSMARYVRWLVELSGARVTDPCSQSLRAVRYGDIGVLAITTTHLPLLFDAFDREGVPFAARGGSLFLSDLLHRRFLLALCALADRDDGVALAALLRPPFFAIDLGDLARCRPEDPADRAVQARAIVRDLRRRRFERPPGATARALLEETGLGATVALGPNGRQRLMGLRELCFQIEKRAQAQAFDFDAVVAQIRSWVEQPQGLDRPHPIGGDAVRVLTVHQAKGLEFPAVMLWDARASWRDRATYDAWTVDRDGRGWALRLDALQYEEPPQLEIERRERQCRDAERKRLVYVAATRARDILIVPKVGAHDGRWILSALLGDEAHRTVLEQPLHRPDARAPWFDAAEVRAASTPERMTPLDTEVRGRWEEQARAAATPYLRPVAFTDASAPPALWGKKGRFGSLFGETVHLAIGLVLRTRASPSDAVAAAAGRTGLTAHILDAVADVARAAATLNVIAIGTSSYELEYPVTGVAASGNLVSGYVDVIASIGRELVLLDFKTDAPPEPGESVAQRYIDQVLGYAAVLERALEIPVRAGLLYTATGTVHWLSSGGNARA